jgi:hypothetical protein
VPWPRAARNGRVEIRSLETGSVVRSFRPQGIVRAVALSETRAVVILEYLGSRTIESYDIASGRRLSVASVPQSARRLSTDGRHAAFIARTDVRVLDLESGRQRIVRRAQTFPSGLWIRSGRLVWAENGPSTARILAASA